MRKRNGVPSGELSDTRRLGSADARWYTSQGEKAVFRRRSMAARNAVKTPGETARGAGARPRCDAPRRTRPEVPRAALFWAEAGIPRSEAKSPKAMSIRGAEPSRVRRLRQDSPPTAYMHTPSGAKDAGIGRSRKASTVARNKAAHWKANTHRTAIARHCSHLPPVRAMWYTTLKHLIGAADK